MIFCLALIPVLAYLQNIFAMLQLEKISQRMNAGVAQIENVVSCVLNTSQTLTDDPRFITLCYRNPDYNNIPVDIQRQLRRTFDSLISTQDIISDSALLLDQNAAVLPNAIFFEHTISYYPDFFQVDNLSYEEWYELLEQNQVGFMTVHHVTTYHDEYDALIYSVKWQGDAYLYACLDIADIKNLLIAESEQSDCYFSLTHSDGTVLYSDLPENEHDVKTIGTQLSNGYLSINVYIAKSLFYQMMKPVYFFLMLYGATYFVLLVLIILTGTRISSNPILGIIRILENCRNIFGSETDGYTDNNPGKNRDDFDFISNSILSADKHLEQYQQLIHTQQKILQARFLEKAISGQLTDPRDIAQFHSYFPDFPDEGYYLLMIRLQTNADAAGEPYKDPLLILQSFLQSELPNAYQQQFSDSDLILLTDQKNFADHCQILDFLVDNINREEPSYTIRCVASHCCKSLENLPAAYRQLQNIVDFPFFDRMHRVCTIDALTDINPFVKELIQYIDTHYTDCNLCLTTLTSHFDCSAATIRKAFKNVLNITAIDYIEQKRMHRANELLAQNEKSVTDIAAECGYASLNSFYKAYRKVYGHAPSGQGTER